MARSPPPWITRSASPLSRSSHADSSEASEEAHAASTVHKPWFAIGGLDAGNVHEVVERGATRIVVVRAITEAEDPEAAARFQSLGAGDAPRLADAQRLIAQQYGFATWAELKAHVESAPAVDPLEDSTTGLPSWIWPEHRP